MQQTAHRKQKLENDGGLVAINGKFYATGPMNITKLLQFFALPMLLLLLKTTNSIRKKSLPLPPQTQLLPKLHQSSDIIPFFDPTLAHFANISAPISSVFLPIFCNLNHAFHPMTEMFLPLVPAGLACELFQGKSYVLPMLTYVVAICCTKTLHQNVCMSSFKSFYFDKNWCVVMKMLHQNIYAWILL